MYLVQKNRVRGLNTNEYKILLRLARLSKNVYNTSLWHIKNHYETEKKYLSYPKLYPTMKHDTNYQQLPSQVAQQTMKYVDRAIKSFFSLLRLKKQGKYIEPVEFPFYKPKNGYFPCVFPKDQFKITNDGETLRLSLERHFTKQEGLQYLFFDIPKHIRNTTIKEVRLVPQWEGKAFDIEYVYQAKQEHFTLESNKHLAIDLGLDNFATCVSSANVETSEPAFIIEGRGLKSWNQWWNKEHARLQSLKDKSNRKHISKREFYLYQKRRSITRNYVFQAVHHVVNHCLTHNIGSLIIGELPDIKRDFIN